MMDKQNLKQMWQYSSVLKVLLLVVWIHVVNAGELYCSNDELSASDTMKPRLMAETANRLIILDAITFPCFGRVKSWIYYSTKDVEFKPGVWRLQTGTQYKLVGENTVNASSDGYTEYEVPKAERIRFQPGDLIGFRHANPALDYDMGLDATDTHYKTISDYTTELEPGTVIDVSSTEGRSYSLRAIFEDEYFDMECNHDYHGPEAIARDGQDNGIFIMIFHSQPMTCFGQVKAWKIWGEDRNGGIKVGVYRPDDENENDFMLIAETEIPADHAIGEQVTYEIPDQVDWISFEPGDVIGFRQKSRSTNLRRSTSGLDIYDMKYTAHTDDSYNNLGPGETFTLGSALTRAYSLQAVLSPKGYIGCFEEDYRDRDFGVSIGNYDTYEMTPEYCIKECAARSYLYAAVQEGNQCYCSDTYGAHSTGNNSACDYPCTGNSYLNCGGYFHNKVFTTPPVMIGFNAHPTELTRTYYDAEFSHNITSGFGVTYSYDFGDGFSMNEVTALNLTHIYGKPGDYAIVTTAADPWKNTDSETIPITIESEITEVMVDCPPAVEYDTRFGCKFWVYQGTNISVQINFTNGRVIDFDIEDAETLHYGTMLDHDSTLDDQPDSTLYLKINDAFTYDGRLVAWEFNAVDTGVINLQVYRPRCGSQWEKFCYRSFSCIRRRYECGEQDSIWNNNTVCAVNGNRTAGRFSFTSRDCIRNDNTLEGTHIFESMPLDFEYVGEIEYDIPKLGRNFVSLDLDEHIDVLKGDVIGWYNSGAGKIAYIEATKASEFLPDVTDFDARNTDGFTGFATGSAIHDYEHSLKAHVVRPSLVHVYHNYTWPENRRNITITANSTFSTDVFDIQEIKVQEYIVNVSFIAPTLAVTTEQETLYVEDHPGTEVTYHWWFGNGDYAVTQEMSINYTWPDDGVYNITLMAENDISFMVVESWVVLQHRITNFTWMDSVPPTTWPQYPVTPKIFGNETIINFGMYKGSNVTYEVSIGDDIVPTFFMQWYEDVDVDGLLPNRTDPLSDRLQLYHDGIQGSVVTVYESIGYFPIYINVSNRVSWATLETMAIVQIDIVNFRIVRPPPFPYGNIQLVGIRYDTGTNITIIGEFNNIPMNLTNSSLYHMNDLLGEGFVAITPDLYDDRGFYPLEFTAWNLVSGPYTDSVLLQIEFAIEDFKMWTSEIYVIPGTPISFSFDMLIGSDLTFEIDYDDDNVTVIETLQMKRKDNDSFTEWHDFDVAADYNVTIWASSCVSNVTVWTYIKVQNPVDNVTMEVYTPGVIPFEQVGLLRHDFPFHGNQYGPPTDAEVDYTFTKGRKVIVYNELFPIQTYNPVVQNMSLAKVGTYDLAVNISNLVSWMLFTATIDMEQPILNFTVECPKPHIKVDKKARLIASMTWGSRVSFFWDFKDGHQVSVDVGGNQDRKHEYKVPGTYYVTVYASNLLGHVSYTLPDPVKVQYAVRSMEWTGRRLNRLYTAQGYTTVPFQLHMATEIPFPTEAQFEIDWDDGNTEAPADLTQDGANPSLDTEVLTHIFSVSHNYLEWGNYNITLHMWNLVSDVTLVYNIWIYETITQLQKELAYNELIMDGDYSATNVNDTEDQEGFGAAKNYFPLEQALVVKATHASGTGLTYTWDFGDVFYEAPPTTPTPNITTTEATTTDSNMTTIPIMTTMQRNCSMLRLDWVNQTIQRLYAEDEQRRVKMWESRQPNCSLVYPTPPPFNWTAYNLSLANAVDATTLPPPADGTVWCNLTEIALLNQEKDNNATCPEGWQTYGGNCYYIDLTPDYVDTARQTCSDLNSTLASIHSQLEQDFLLNAIGNTPVWLGLTNDTDGTIRWLDGSELNFTSGDLTEMLNGSEPLCAILTSGNGGSEWQFVSCDNATAGVVCKSPLGNATSDSTATLNCTMPTTTSEPPTTEIETTTESTTEGPYTVCAPLKPIDLLLQEDACANITDKIMMDMLNTTHIALLNYTYFYVGPNDTFSMDDWVNFYREFLCLGHERILIEAIDYVWKYNMTDIMEPLICQEEPPPTDAPPTTSAPPTTTRGPTIPPTTQAPYVVETTEPRAIWWYNRRGMYRVTLNISNPVHWVTVTKTVVIQRSIFDLSMSDHGPRPRNTTIEFQLNTGNIGTDVCYFMDFRDVTSEVNQYAFWGHQETCEAKYPDHFADEFLRFTEVSNNYLEGLAAVGLDPNITLTNIFMKVNLYGIRLVAHNMVSEQFVKLPTAVTKGLCFYPVLTVKDKNKCDQYYPFCDEFGNREYYASRDVFVYSTAELNCTSAKYAMYTWRAFSINERQGTEDEIYDLGDSEMSGFTRRELAIKSSVLDYGLYRFELNVSMWGEIGVESIEDVSIRVVPTPLVVLLGGGSERMVRWNEIISIDGESGTYDPDVARENREGIRYIWLCRREHETFSVWNWNYTEMIAPGTVNASFVHEKDDYGGCFGRAGFDRGGYGSKLNFTTGIVEFDTFYMFEEMTYELKLIVMKGTRETITSQTLYVATGNPPNMVITCKTNCKNKLNPTSRAAFESRDLDARKGVRLYYRWELFRIVPAEEDKVSYVKIPTAEWLSYSGTGDSMANLALEPNLFADDSEYRISVFADRNPKFTNFGKASNDILTNDRPLIGNCSVSPENGTALDTEFNVLCVDWSDPDMPLNYRYAKRLRPDEAWTWMYSGEKPFMETPAIFPQGFEDQDFEVYILVRVDDFIGSFSDLELSVKVIAPVLSKAEMSEKLNNLTGEGSPMATMIASGDSASAANVVAACAGMLNIAAEEAETTSVATTMASYTTTEAATTLAARRRRSMTTASYGTTVSPSAAADAAAAAAEAERLERESMRENMIGALALSQPNTVGQMKQVASAFQVATSNTAEITTTSASSTVATGEKFLGVLQDQAGLAGADEVEESGAGILCMVGNAVNGAIQKAAAVSARADSAAEARRALLGTTTIAPDYDYYGGRAARNAEGSASINDDYLLEQEEAAAEAELAEMRSLNRDLSESTQNLVGGLMGTVNGNMVTGQAPVNINSPTMSLAVDKSFTSTMSGKSYGGGEAGGSSFNMPQSDTMFGTGNDTLPSVDAQVIIEKKNSRTWSNSSSAVVGGTASINLRNDTGGPINLDSLDAPLQVWLSRGEEDVDLSSIDVIYNHTKPQVEPMIIHVVTVPGLSSLHLEAHALDWNGTDANNVSLYIYMRIGKAPTLDIYDFNCTLPHDYSGWEYENVSLDTLPDQHTCFLSNTLLNSYSNGTDIDVYVGLKHSGGINESVADEFYANSQYGTSFWPIYYALRPYSSSCSYYDDSIEDWISEGCEVGDLSTLYSTQCLCWSLGPPNEEVVEVSETGEVTRRRRRRNANDPDAAASGATFGGGFKVPMNKVDFSQNAFSMLDENPVVFVFMVCCIAIYMTVLLWARKADQRDKVQAGATPLVDNDPRDHFNYEVTVFTGVRSGSFTTAKVSIILTGESETSRPRLLLDPARKVFQTSGIDTFILSCPRSLGNLQHVRIWHNNSGKHPKWFLSRLAIKDMSSDRQYFFMLDRWLAVEEDDGQIERVIPVAGKSELTSFGFLFYSKTRRNLSDGHLWFSVFARPARSNFTRCQRATCCLALLFSTMMSNIFFYGVDITSGNAGGKFILGPIEITVGQICVGVISSLMVFPPSLLVVQMFRLSRPPPERINWFWKRKKKQPKDKTEEEIETDKAERMDEKAEEELQNQLEFLETGDESRRNLKSRKSRKVSFADGKDGSDSDGIDQKESRDEGFEDDEEEGEKKEGEDGEMKLVGGLKNTGKKKKTKFMLPWGCMYIGWTSGLLIVGYSFYLTIQVAGGFGKEKATEWLQTMICSLIQDILFSQPIKVLCLATFYALVIKKPDKEDENPSSPALKGDEEFIHERLTEEELKDPDKLEALEQQKMMCPVKPPDLDDIAEAREVRFKEIKMHAVLKEIWLYSIFLLVLFLMGYGNIPPSSYFIQQSVRGTFLTADYNGNVGFTSITTRANFWTHVKDSFVPSLYVSILDNGEVDVVNHNQKYIADRAHILLGTARMRQLRVYPESCKIPEIFEETVYHCRDLYSAMDDVELSYDEGWTEYNRTIGIDHDSTPQMGVWKYRDWAETGSYPQYAKQGVYYGGGFTVEFGNSQENDLAMVDYLRDNMWVDQHTRAVFFELAVYNPVNNVHVFIMNLVEFPPSGAAFPFVSIRTMTLDHYYGMFAYFVMAAEAVFCVFLLWFLYKEFRNLKRQKKEYFKSISNWFEIITLGLAIGGIVGYFYKLFMSMSLMETINAAPNEFHSFQYLAYWDDIFMSMVGLLIFFATIKFIKLMRFNKKMLLLSHTIYNFAHELSLFMVMFAVVYMAFSSFCYLNFQKLKDYSNFLLTLESLFGTLLGKFDFNALLEADRVLGPMFFFLYVMLVMWTLVNMFVAIICDGFARAREAQAEMQNELEIVDFMMDRFKLWTGFGGEKRIKAEPKIHKYIEGVEDIDRECDELRVKLDDMVSRLNNFVVSTKRDDKELFGDPDEKGKQRVIFTG